MVSVATDTLRTAETLIEAGVPERQAAVHARAVDAAVADAVGDLVTRDQLRAETAKLRAEMAATRDELRTEMATLRAEMAATRDELRTEMATTRDELRTEMGTLRVEMGTLRVEMATLRVEMATTRDQLTWRLLGGLGALLALFRLSGWLIP